MKNYNSKEAIKRMKVEISIELGINTSNKNTSSFEEITKRLARIGEEYVKKTG